MRAKRPTVVRRRRPVAGRPMLPAGGGLPMAGAGPPGMPPAGMPPMGGPPGAGAMPSMKRGGTVKKTGPHKLHKGEKVVPAHKAKKKR